MKVYTRSGDKGTTSLIGGERVSKCDARVEAYGTVDELSAHMAMLGDLMGQREGFSMERQAIERIQGELMIVEAQLAAGPGSHDKVSNLAPVSVHKLEEEIDLMSEHLPPVKGFVIPGGDPIVSQSHICRTVCRRAERRSLAVNDPEGLLSASVAYLNRLSDWLYTVGRRSVEILSIKDTYWIP